MSTILQANFATKQVTSPDGPDVKPTIGVAGDCATRTIRFQLEKDTDELPKGIALSAVTWEMQYENANLQRGSIIPDSVSEQDGNLVITFTIPASLAVAPGDCQIQLCGSSGTKHWHLSPMTVQIGDFFDPGTIEESDPKYDLLNQLSGKVSQLEAADFLTEADAESTYLKKTDASSTYLKIADAYDGRFHRHLLLGAGTGPYLVVMKSECHIKFSTEYDATIPIKFIQDDGEVAFTYNLNPNEANKSCVSVFDMKSNDHDHEVHICTGAKNTALPDPMMASSFALPGYRSLDHILIGPLPERITCFCLAR